MPRTRTGKTLRAVTDAEIDAAVAETAAEAASLHDLFSRQVRTVLDESGLSEDEKQQILVAMACPCCGAGPGTLTYKLPGKR